MGYAEWVARKQDACTLAEMRAHLPNARPLSEYRQRTRVRGKNRMGAFDYILHEPPAESVRALHTDFTLKSGGVRRFEPHLLPHEMLKMGVFNGKIICDCMDEFPREWYEGAIAVRRLAPRPGGDAGVNAYGVSSRQSLRIWKERGWLVGDADERGWFQWYCRYALGRRDPPVDRVQMRRWRAMARWYGVLKAQRTPSRRVQQALLQWSWPQDAP